MRRYSRLLAIQLRTSVLLGLQYRWDFALEGLLEAFWTITALVPLVVVYQDRRSIAGWSFPEALLVLGWFTVLQAVIEGAINPSVTQVVEHVRKGTLDFVLLKPADAQFLVSTAKFQPWKAMTLLVAGAIFGFAFHRMGHGPSIAGVGLSAVLFCASVTILYSMWILTVSAAFVVVRVDNLTYLFSSIFDAARWPAPVFRGVVRALFTFVIPLALMTTYPAEALLGRLDLRRALFAIVSAIVFAFLSRAIWKRAIGRYTSASS
jgi:ABC-2 type transport system permease protein